MSSENVVSNNKRIAKNTMYLYIRMLLTMTVSLYTSRVVLNALGASDYGINNVVGGTVSMFAFLSGTIATAVQRFLSIALGQGDSDSLKKIFECSQFLIWGISIFTIILLESVGLYLLNTQLVIPEDRMYAAHWVFQLSTISLFVSMISIPYNAAIIAHEKMSAFASLSLVDIFLKLLIAFSLLILSDSIDSLIFYASLICLSSIVMRVLYTIYCKRNFSECRNLKVRYDKQLVQSMLSFFSWNTIGACSYVAKEQGINIVLNIFCGTIVNAARGITGQVTGALYGFISNFQVAMNPQITKYYAQHDYENLYVLVFRGAKFSFYLFFFLALPVYIDIDYLLKMWLTNVPDHTSSFVRLTILLMFLESISSPVITCLLAVGRVKVYQIVVGTVLLLNLPLSYIALKCGLAPESALFIAIILAFVSLCIRLYLLKIYINFPLWHFVKSVILQPFTTAIVSYLVCDYIFHLLDLPQFFELLCIILIAWLLSGALIYTIGLSLSERKVVNQFISKLSSKIIHKK